MTTYPLNMSEDSSMGAAWAKRRGEGSDQHGPGWGVGTAASHESGASRSSADQRARSIERLRWLATLMDSAFEIPGTKFRVGLDGLVGLVPGVGDAATLLVSAYIVFEARRLGATRMQLAAMTANVLIDSLVGTVPVLGDVFDLAFKANIRNLKILGIDVSKGKEPKP
jgi:hypothetical protein